MSPERRFHFVEDDAALAAVVPLLSEAREIGVDAEMNGLHAYRASICVLQIATADADVVIDTLAVKNLESIRAILAAPGVTRYLHGAAHDVKCLKGDFGFGIGGLFDTYVAAQMLGVEKLGYGDIVATRFGVPLDKRLQTTDWGKRPLTQQHVDYLRADIRFLIPLGQQLAAELAARDLVDEAAFECERVAALPPETDALAEDGYLRPKEARELAPLNLAILRELFLTRDVAARRADRPPFKIAAEPVLVEIAKRKPATVEELGRIPGLPRSGNVRLLEELFAAVGRGIAAGAPPPIKREAQSRPDGAEIRARRAREDALRSWRKQVALLRGVPPMVVLPSYAVEDLVRALPRGLDDLATRPGMIPKRMRLYAQEILALPAMQPAVDAARPETPR